METLPAFRYCFEVAAAREATDRERSWQWSIRRMVLRWSIARLERVETGAEVTDDLSSGSLTPAERRTLELSHPLLRPAETPALPAYEPTAAWRAAIHARVLRYVESLRARG